MQCTTSTSRMLRAPNADYIIISGLAGRDAVMELHRRKYTELLERYKIREGTCASALLGKIVSFVPFEGDDDELLPYSSLLSDEKFEKWPKSTIRRNIRRLRDLGVVQLRSWDDIEEDRRKFLSKFEEVLKETGISLRKIYSKVVVPMERLSKAEFEKLDKLSDGLYKPSDDMVFIPRLLGNMYSATEEDAALIGDDKIIRKEDIRSLSLEEKAAKLMKLYREFVKPRKRTENDGYNKSGHDYEERRRVAREYAEGLKSMPHIKDVYVAGSLAIGDDEEGSDIDLLLCRYNCPGKERCLETLSQENVLVDFFCYTPEEIEELRKAGALITFFSIPYERWKNIE